MMATAVNPQTGEVLRLNEQTGTWEPDTSYPPVSSAYTPVRQIPRETMGLGEGLAAATGQGLLAGFGDEAVGALSAGRGLLSGDIGLGQVPARYREARDLMRGESEAFARERPVANIAGNVVGGLGSLGLGGAKLAGTAWARLHPYLAGIATGGAAGGIAGAGGAEELGDVPGATMRGAGAGALAGAVVPPVLSAAGKAVAGLGRGVGRAAATPEVYARRKVAEALARDQMPASDMVARMRGMGPEARAVDAGGANVLGLGETVANIPGRATDIARKFLEARQKESFTRLMGDLRRVTGKDGQFLGAMKDIVQRRSDQARPLYQAAANDTVDPAKVAEVADYATRRALDFSNTTIGSALKRAAATLYAKTAGVRVPKQNVGTSLHASKMAVDDMIDAAKRAGRKQEAAELIEFKGKLLGIMDEASPSYREARQVFSDNSRIKDALELGRRALRDDAEETADMVSRLTGAERDAYLTGVAKSIRDKLATVNDKANSALRIAGRPDLREKLEAALGPGQFDDFMKAVTREERFTEVTNTILRNSSTARRQEAAGDLASDAVDIATMGPVGTLLRRVKDMVSRREDIPEAARDELSRLLFELGPDAMERALRNRGVTQVDAEALVRQLRGASAASAGGAAGQLVPTGRVGTQR